MFVDGDYWHGNDWESRRAKLFNGHNGDYWVRKIEYNMQRDREVTDELVSRDWLVIRVWESEVKNDAVGVAKRIAAVVTSRS